MESIFNAMENNTKLFDTLTEILSKEKETTIGATLILRIANIYDELIYIGCCGILDSLTETIKEKLYNKLEKLIESLRNLIEVDNNNGGSLGCFLKHISEHEYFTIGMVGLTESKYQIIINDKGELVQIPSLCPISKETGKPIIYEY